MRSNNKWSVLADDRLLYAYRVAQEEVAALRQEIEMRMMERGATAIPDDHYLCEMPKRFSYDPALFTPLKEVLSSQELDQCWKAPWDETVPEHVENHPERWDTVKLLAVARRHGAGALQVVKAARTEARGGLVFKRRDAKEG